MQFLSSAKRVTRKWATVASSGRGLFDRFGHAYATLIVQAVGCASGQRRAFLFASSTHQAEVGRSCS